MTKSLSEEEKLLHCRMALETADIIFKLATPYKKYLFLEDHREDTDCINPCYQQMAKGLLLELWISRPVGIVTPWGLYSFFGWYDYTAIEHKERQIWQKINSQLGQSNVNLVLFKPVQEIKIDTIHGDLFEIISVNNSLPLAVERGYSDFESHDTARKEWARLVKQVRKKQVREKN